MALTRYLHFAFTLNTAQNISALRGLEIYDAGGVDLTIALGIAGFAGQSSQYDATTTYQGQNAFDHSDSSVWAAAGNDPGWLRYDLGSAKDVRSVVFRSRNDTNTQTPISATVYGSTSGYPTASPFFGMDMLAPAATLSQTTGASTTVAVGASTYQPFVPPLISGIAQVFDFLSRAGPQPDKVTRVRNAAVVQDFKGNFGGRGYLSGHTYITGTPNTPDPFVRVALFKESGTFIVSTISDAAGFYRFNGLDPALRYFVVAFDDSHDYNAVIKDNLAPLV